MEIDSVVQLFESHNCIERTNKKQKSIVSENLGGSLMLGNMEHNLDLEMLELQTTNA